VALTGDERLNPLRAALDSEQEEARRRTLSLVACIADRETILRAAENISHEHKDKRAYALELLDLGVPRELREVVLPVVEDMAPERRIEKLEELAPGPGLSRDEVMRQIVVHPPYWLRPWTRACAVWSAKRIGLHIDAILPEAAADDHMVSEALEWVQGTWKGAPHMLTVEKVMILKGVQMFSRTPEEVLEDLAAILEEVDLKKDEYIFRQGDPGDSMYIIIDGGVRVLDGERQINQLGARDIFGELALLDPEPRSASVQAMEDTRLFRIDRETFSELMAGSISIVRGVLHVLCERLRRLIPGNAARPAALPPAVNR
jgi:CRP-like cAMP-binding protein